MLWCNGVIYSNLTNQVNIMLHYIPNTIHQGTLNRDDRLADIQTSRGNSKGKGAYVDDTVKLRQWLKEHKKVLNGSVTVIK